MRGSAPSLFVALLLGVGPWLSLACGDTAAGRPVTEAAADDPIDFGSVGDFELVERGGRTVRLADLRGRTWIVDFIFTTSAGPCTKISEGMRELKAELEADGDSGIGLLSFSVDPLTDDVPTLANYGERWGADPDRWWFLTGEEADIHRLMRESFLLGVERDASGRAAPGQQVTHATRFVVVDPAGRLRGYYDGRSEEGRRLALERARAVHRAADGTAARR